ncbi:DUF262 domain-containing HNH endonuclease family protein [Aliarcobacter butzleri]|uniref:DUF262 domain-containing protein n=1 Tax=Aliarcobacter butzleri TaxID=28197 RepID=UPI00263D3778|nr:DUF262 domain-containing HNH endonuclease family protein [Aliarcobacter butzleri]MDN5124753.1 DUF262 domain-containing HNH endonuclease family protein [Aliarcobacter butzleri]
MKIEPSYTNLKKLFASQATYFVPKYQRAYAWSNESIKDFLGDLDNCYENRLLNKDSNHFFGGILSIKHTITGAVDEHTYEVIDGQQRITTFTLTIRCLINVYEDLLGVDVTKDAMIEKRIENLKTRFIEFIQEINLEEQIVKVFTPSKRDNEFYSELMKRNIIDDNPERYSHKNLLNSYKKISKFFNDKIKDEILIDKLKILQTFEFVLDSDFTLLHMVSDSKKSAYRLFQVINDRGMSLTEGDLLRSKTLELIEDFPSIQSSVEIIWDKILSSDPNTTSKYLTWIYTSYTGKDLKKNELFDIFLDQFFPQHKNIVDQNAANEILSTMRALDNDFKNCRKMSGGEWIYEIKQPVTAWDRNRFEVLMHNLNHDLAMPLFIASSKLTDKKFSEVVQLSEKIFFRYILICKQHLNSLKSIYFSQIKKIRQNSGSYTTDEFKTKINSLIDSKANDTIFETNLKELEYNKDETNKYLKYFLMTLEYHFPHYLQDPTKAVTKCLNKTSPYDFAGTSIEHIYPKNALTADINQDIEDKKNTIGNLALMDPLHNSEQGNKKFLDKKSEYASSSIEVLKYVSGHTDWSITELQDLETKYINLALKHFRA